MELTRRAFLGLTGLIATTAGAVEDLIKYRLLGLPPPAADEELLPRAPEQWAPSVCQLCPAGCGVAARVVQGRVVKLEGLPAHPVNQGALCPRGAAGLTELYHPDRLLQPLRRVGERGEGRFEPVAWEEAMPLLVDRLRGLRQRGEPQRLAWLSGPSRSLGRQLIQRFLRAWGSPHDLVLSPPAGELPAEAFRLMVDREGEPLYDLAQANLLLSFGLDWLQAYPSPVEASRAYGWLRQGRSDRRARIVQVEPRLSMTAAKSDEWIPIRPGQDGWLALGIAHVLIRERLIHDQLAQNSVGLEPFARFVASRADPEAVAERTGVPPETIQRLAKEFGLRRGLAMGARADLMTQWAVMSLNGLVGNLDARGGVLRRWEPPGLSLPPEPARDDVAERGLQAQRLAHAERLPEHLLDGTEAPIEILCVHQANPCFISPSPSRWVEALGRMPFIVSFASMLDETALHADLVLPLATALEQWQFASVCTSDGRAAVNITPPVVPPRGAARALEEVILQLARALGPPVAGAFPWDSVEPLVKERAQALYETKSGTPLPPIRWSSETMREADKPPTSGEGLLERLRLGGGAVWPAEDAPWAEFRTPSGRLELFPDAMTTLLETASAEAGGGEAQHAPLQLYLYSPLAFLAGTGAHLPFLQQIAGRHLSEAWETWAELHPSTARQFGIRDGERIWIASLHGKVEATARWCEGVVPGVVAMPLGLGHLACGRWAKDIGANPAHLVGRRLDEQTGQPFWQGTLVKVWKA